MSNPFTISFGKEPKQLISRQMQTGVIYETFTDEEPSGQAYMITGVRGSGKTVALTTLAKRFLADGQWIVLELNPSSDLLTGMAAKLYNLPEMHPLFVKASFNFSMLGFGASVTGKDPVTDLETAIRLMLDRVIKEKKRVLIAIDEVTNTPQMRTFIHAFQILMRYDYPVFLLMTGLYDNIYDLQNDKALTFLYRAPKIELPALSISAVANSYRKIFHLTGKESAEMAALTKGYPFAFQVLGYLRWQNSDQSLAEIMPQYDQYLEEYVYEKIWSEMTAVEKQILGTIADGHIQVKEIREHLQMSSGELSVYRKRLHRKGVVDISTYGRIQLTLPRFAEIVQLFAAEYSDVL